MSTYPPHDPTLQIVEGDGLDAEVTLQRGVMAVLLSRRSMRSGVAVKPDKGNLYLLVTSRTSSRHALEATRLAAETIRNEYYYDESA